MRVEFEKDGDIFNREFTMELCNAVAPFIPHGSAKEFARIAGISAPYLVLIKNVSNLDQVKIKLDTLVSILNHIENGPRVFAVCGEHRFDFSGMDFRPVITHLKPKVERLLSEHYDSYTRVQQVTGIRRSFLSSIIQDGATKWTIHRALGALEAICGPVYLELEDPAEELRIPRSVDLGKAESPYESMVTMLRKASLRNIKFYKLDIDEVAKEADIDLSLMDSFFDEKPVQLTLSSMLDIAKACRCEVSLFVR